VKLRASRAGNEVKLQASPAGNEVKLQASLPKQSEAAGITAETK
jgi:hypothetical protein